MIDIYFGQIGGRQQFWNRRNPNSERKNTMI